MSVRTRVARLRRSVLAAMITAALCGPVWAAAEPRTPAPAPAALPALSAESLDARYTANRGNIAEAAEMAKAAGDVPRERALRALAAPGRHFLSFDGRGEGRAVEVLGDLAAADRISILVPGSDTTLDTFDGPSSRIGGAARSLQEQIHRQAPEAKVAVVAWLGYTPPKTISTDVLTTTRAEDGARELRGFVSALEQANDAAGVSLMCHSYGSVVCGRAASGLEVADIAVYGSPGTGADSLAQWGTAARVWAARGEQDWISYVPNVSATFLGTTVGFGADPTSAAFGARVFASGAAGHSDYLAPHSVSLKNLARIALGTAQEVSGD
ncbi:alpha/beta hydrolase family protein [Streptomyces sp. NBC_00322]|uniref:alpha/beta hydrolase n=1 Tax=Streptomyces sp. NBC_00322 TaxID=2975712 RepID=UPI002E2A1CE8|nr:alpha/beta hydrolase [Streptomyces sp. NBC_00322]